MGKHFAVDDIVASKIVKEWGKVGKVVSVHGTTRSVRFVIQWNDGTSLWLQDRERTRVHYCT